MPKEYTEPEDFATDSSFIRYCFYNNKEDADYWIHWSAEHPEQQENIRKAIDLLQLMSVKTLHNKKQIEWNKLRKELQLSNNAELSLLKLSENRRKMMRVAAIIVCIILGAGVTYWLLKKPVATAIVYQTSAGETQKIILPDKTEVWLNSKSKLTYNKSFKNADRRDVMLDGEAYFKVKKEYNRPFTVHTKDFKVEVLGTEFNVSAYSGDLTSSATLVQGAIQVRLENEPENKIRLKPNEKLTVLEHNNIAPAHKPLKETKKSVTSNPPKYEVSAVHHDPLINNELVETAWLKGELVFRDESFETLAVKMSRKYGVDFQFENDSLKVFHFTGIFTDETLAQALNALQLTSPSSPFGYTIKDDKVLITTQKTE